MHWVLGSGKIELSSAIIEWIGWLFGNDLLTFDLSESLVNSVRNAWCHHCLSVLFHANALSVSAWAMWNFGESGKMCKAKQGERQGYLLGSPVCKQGWASSDGCSLASRGTEAIKAKGALGSSRHGFVKSFRGKGRRTGLWVYEEVINPFDNLIKALWV